MQLWVTIYESITVFQQCVYLKERLEYVEIYTVQSKTFIRNSTGLMKNCIAAVERKKRNCQAKPNVNRCVATHPHDIRNGLMPVRRPLLWQQGERKTWRVHTFSLSPLAHRSVSSCYISQIIIFFTIHWKICQQVFAALFFAVSENCRHFAQHPLWVSALGTLSLTWRVTSNNKIKDIVRRYYQMYAENATMLPPKQYKWEQKK